MKVNKSRLCYFKYVVTTDSEGEMHVQRVPNLFEKRIEHMIKTYEDECMNMICACVVTDINYGKKYRLTHEFNPEGDTAGRLQREKENLSVEEFSNFGEFLSIYSGKSVVSNLPGRSLFHHTYEDKYMERLIEHFMGIFDKECLMDEQRVVKEKLHSSFYLEEDELEIAEGIEEVGVYMKSSVSSLLEKLKKRDLKWLYMKGMFCEK